MKNPREVIATFLRGMGSILNLAGSPIDPPKTDAEALREDWAAVGQDLSAAMAEVRRTLPRQR